MPPEAGVALPMSIVRLSSALNLFGEAVEDDPPEDAQPANATAAITGAIAEQSEKRSDGFISDDLFGLKAGCWTN